MRTEYLDYLVKVVEVGTLTGAASQLYISPQGMSHAMQQLEHDFSTTLFYKKNNRLVLTKAGEQVYQFAKNYHESESQLMENIHKLQMSVTDSDYELNIYTTKAITMTYLPKILWQFRKRNPLVKMNITETYGPDSFENIDNSVQSIHLLMLDDKTLKMHIKENPDLIIHEIYRCPFSAIMSAQSPMADRPIIETNDLAEAPLVLFGLDKDTLETQFGLSDLNISMNTTDLSMAITMLSLDKFTMGITNRIFEIYYKNTALITKPLIPQANLICSYFVTGNGSNSPMIDEFIELLNHEFMTY